MVVQHTILSIGLKFCIKLKSYIRIQQLKIVSKWGKNLNLWKVCQKMIPMAMSTQQWVNQNLDGAQNVSLSTNSVLVLILDAGAKTLASMYSTSNKFWKKNYIKRFF